MYNSAGAALASGCSGVLAAGVCSGSLAWVGVRVRAGASVWVGVSALWSARAAGRRVLALGAAALAGARAGFQLELLEGGAARLVGAGGKGMGRVVLTKGGG